MVIARCLHECGSNWWYGEEHLIDEALSRNQERVNAQFPDGVIRCELNVNGRLDDAMRHIVTSMDPDDDGKEIESKVRNWCSRRECLIVLDGAESVREYEQGMGIQDLVGMLGKCGVIVTTRDQRDVVDHDRCLHLETLDQAMSETLYEMELGRPVEAEDETVALRSICEALGGLPLAIRLSAGVCEKQWCAIGEIQGMGGSTAVREVTRTRKHG